MKKQNQSFSALEINAVAKILIDYVGRANIVKACVARNRGGAKESTFNESEVESAANNAIYKVITKVEEYRAARKANPELPVKRQFEDVPLLVSYFNQAFENTLKDLANQAGAQKRSRFTEIHHMLDDVSLDEIHGTWDDVQARDRKDLLDAAVLNLRTALKHEQAHITELIIKGFKLMFVERVTSEEEFAKDMSMNIDDAISMRERILNLIARFCRTEMSEIYKTACDNKTYWETGRDAAKAANKASVAEKKEDDLDLKAGDLSCEVSTVVHSKKVNEKVQLTISVQIIRDAGAVKEVVQTVKSFSAVCDSFPGAQEARAQLLPEVKAAETQARTICANRKKLATELFGESAA